MMGLYWPKSIDKTFHLWYCAGVESKLSCSGYQDGFVWNISTEV